MNNKLSHSSTSKYQECPKAYDYHYNHRLRSKLQSAALLFGSAMDKAIESILKKDVNDPYMVFDGQWQMQEINKKPALLKTCTDIVYAKSDLDFDLLLDEDYAELRTQLEFADEEDLRGQYQLINDKREKFGIKNLTTDDVKLVNMLNWYSLRRKGHLMVSAFIQDILPRITEVLGTQVEVSLDNGQGDAVTGFADMVVRLNGYDKPVILDFKTSSRIYDADSVLVSTQLSLYVHALSDKYENTRLAGYVVVNKNINKNKKKVCSVCGADGTGKRHATCDSVVNKVRCDKPWIITVNPKAWVQFIVNEIPSQLENLVVENIDAINETIKTGKYTRNLNSCVKPWGPCSFYKKCWANSEEDLIKV